MEEPKPPKPKTKYGKWNVALHAEDRDERPVTGADAYQLLASGGEHLSEAVKFIEKGGNSKDATRIIAALARLTPDRINGRWPPELRTR